MGGDGRLDPLGPGVDGMGKFISAQSGTGGFNGQEIALDRAFKKELESNFVSFSLNC